MEPDLSFTLSIVNSKARYNLARYARKLIISLKRDCALSTRAMT